MTESTTTPMKQGAIARPTRIVKDLGTGREYDVTDRFEVEEFLTAGDPEQGEIGVDFYYGNINGGYNNLALPADAVEEVMSADKAAARKPPSAQEIMGEISGELLGSFDGFRTDEVTRESLTREDPQSSAIVFGRTEDGLTFAYEISVKRVWKTDE